MAESLTLPQMLTSAQHEAAGTFEPKPNSLVWHATESGGNPAWLEVTAEKLEEVGCLEPLLQIRKKMLHVDYQAKLAALCQKAWPGYAERNGTTYRKLMELEFLVSHSRSTPTCLCTSLEKLSFKYNC